MHKNNPFIILCFLVSTFYSQTEINLIGLSRDKVVKKTTEMNNVFDSEKQFDQFKFLTYNNIEGTVGYAYYIDKNNICVAQNILTRYSDRLAMENTIRSIEKYLVKIEDNRWLETGKNQIYEWTYKEDNGLLIMHIMPAKL